VWAVEHAQECLDHIRVELSRGDALDLLARFVGRARESVRAVRQHGVVHVGNSHYLRFERRVA
jgi:hypothetical protein